jgi:hypothetical protein
MEGQPFQRRVELARANPGMGVNIPDTELSNAEMLVDEEANKARSILNSWQPDDFETRTVGMTRVTGKVPNKETTETIRDESYLPEEQFQRGLRIQSGQEMNAKDKATVPVWVITQQTEQGKNRASAQESTAHAGLYGAQAENEVLKRNATSPLSPGYVKPGEGAAADKGAEYAGARSQRTVDMIQQILPRVGYSTAGVIGATTGKIPGSPAYDFAADLDAIKANIGFNELQEMRNASKTGGALGQVAIQEINFLQSVLGSLQQGQSPDNLRKNLGGALAKMQASLQRWEEAKAKSGGGQSSAPSPAVDSFLKRMGY